MSPAGIPGIPSRPPEQTTPGTCRVCGCTDEEACVTEWAPLDRLAERDGELSVPAVTCSWIELDLCSRCHGPRRPTRAQACELERIRATRGAIALTAGHEPGELLVHLVARGRGDKHPVLSLSADGRAVSRYVLPEESEAA
jgi:hypothetical protein